MLWSIGIGANCNPVGSPPTPPDKRVRIRRFKQLRSREFDHAEPIKVANRQRAIEAAHAVNPPAAHVLRHFQRITRAGFQRDQRGVSRASAFPMFQVDHSQTMAQPFVQFKEHSGRFAQSEVILPTQLIRAELFHDLFDAFATATSCQLPNPDFVGLQRFRGNAPLDLTFIPIETKTQKLPLRRFRNRAFRFIELQPKLPLQRS